MLYRSHSIVVRLKWSNTWPRRTAVGVWAVEHVDVRKPIWQGHKRDVATTGEDRRGLCLGRLLQYKLGPGNGSPLCRDVWAESFANVEVMWQGIVICGIIAGLSSCAPSLVAPSSKPGLTRAHGAVLCPCSWCHFLVCGQNGPLGMEHGGWAENPKYSPFPVPTFFP